MAIMVFPGGKTTSGEKTTRAQGHRRPPKAAQNASRPASAGASIWCGMDGNARFYKGFCGSRGSSWTPNPGPQPAARRLSRKIN